MDLSKLPKMSHTPPPPPQQPADASPPPVRAAEVVVPDVGFAGTIWISLIIGVLLMALGWRFAGYLAARAAGRPFPTGVTWASGPKAGQAVEYFELEGFPAWTESGLFIFGVALILEAAALTVVHSRMGGKVAAVTVALVIALGATIYNVVVAAKFMRAGIAPLTSGLAVAFGGFSAMYLWKLRDVLRTHGAAPMT